MTVNNFKLRTKVSLGNICKIVYWLVIILNNIYKWDFTYYYKCGNHKLHWDLLLNLI